MDILKERYKIDDSLAFFLLDLNWRDSWIIDIHFMIIAVACEIRQPGGHLFILYTMRTWSND